MPYAIWVARELRSRGLRVELSLLRKRLSKELSNVDRLGIPFAIIIGPSEAERKVVALRDMRAKEQHEVSVDEAAELILKAVRGMGW